MSARRLKTLDVRSGARWRGWLARHHDSASEIWLVFHKRHTGRASVAYEDAVNEALCYGWIDSLVKRLDDDRYVRKFTPRKATSVWSPSNRARYAALKAAGRLTAAGVNRPPTARGLDPPTRKPTRVPRFITDTLKAQPPAWARFQALSPSQRRLYVGWIGAAKRRETKLRRLQEAAALLAAGKTLGLK